MPGTDRSVTVLTGLIIAALYVIMLVGFSRESYMRRDAERAAGASGWTIDADAAGTCQIDRQICLSGTSRRVEPSAALPGQGPPGSGLPAR